MPGRNDAADGSGGKDTNRKPASTHNAPTSSWQCHASRCNEAGRDGTEERHDLATTIRKSKKRDPTGSNDPKGRRAAMVSGWCVRMDNTKASPEGQSARAGAHQGGRTQQIHKAVPPNQKPRSESQQPERRIDHGALLRFPMEPDQNHASNTERRPTCQQAMPAKPRAAPGIQ